MKCSGLCSRFREAADASYGRTDSWRPHVTCLTCWLRKFYYRRRGWEGLKRVKHLKIDCESVNPLGTIIPKDYFAYFILIDQHQIREEGYWRMWRIKNFIVKNLLVIAEFFAQL